MKKKILKEIDSRISHLDNIKELYGNWVFNKNGYQDRHTELISLRQFITKYI